MVDLREPLLSPSGSDSDSRGPASPNGSNPDSDKPRSRLVHNISVLQLADNTPDDTPTARLSFLNPFQKWHNQPSSVVLHDILTALFPCLKYLSDYSVAKLKSDVVAGITVGVMLIPQSMAYARIAGLPPQFGLYTGLVPCFAYAIFGSSRQVMVGPVSLVSLLVAEGLAPWANPDKLHPEGRELYQQLAVLLAFMVGVIKACGGLLRMGWVVRFLSHSVVSGFTSGAAIILGLEQVRYWMDCSMPRSSTLHILLRDIYANITKINVPTFTLGLVALAGLLIMKHLGKTRKEFRLLRASGPLMAAVLGTLFVWGTGMKTTTIGEVPQGLPPFSVSWPLEYVNRLLLPALVIIGVGCIESISIAKSLAARNGYELDANQELLGLGLANVFGSMFSAYPSYGSFSRSAVNDESGAKTGLAGLVTGLLVLLTLLFLTPLFVHLPMTILASIVINSVVGLVDYDEAMFLFRVDEKDFLLFVMAFTGTMFLGVQIGVLVSVMISLAFVVNESANPHTAVLGRLPGTTVYRNVKQYPDAITTEGIMALRIDAPIYFANVPFIKDFLRQYELGREKQAVPLQYIIIQMSPVSSIDCTGCHALVTIYNEYRVRGIQLVFVNPNRVVMRTFERAKIPSLIGQQWFFVSVHDAVQVCLADMAARARGASSDEPKPAVAPINIVRQEWEEAGFSPHSLPLSPGRAACKHVLFEEAENLRRNRTFNGRTFSDNGRTIGREMVGGSERRIQTVINVDLGVGL